MTLTSLYIRLFEVNNLNKNKKRLPEELYRLTAERDALRAEIYGREELDRSEKQAEFERGSL